MKKESSGFYFLRIVLRTISLMVGLLFMALEIFRKDWAFCGLFGFVLIFNCGGLYLNVCDFITQLKWEIKEELQDHGD